MIIKLSAESLPDCSSCKDPTKRKVGTAIDAEGPGVISPVYRCENMKCMKKRNALMYFLIKEEQKNGKVDHS